MYASRDRAEGSQRLVMHRQEKYRALLYRDSARWSEYPDV